MTTILAESDIRGKFARLKGEWKERSRHLSNTAQMAMLRPYQRIIGMGRPAVPLILEELRREPDQWFWALESITDENPVRLEDAGDVRLMADAWIRWGLNEGHLASYPRPGLPPTQFREPPPDESPVVPVQLHRLVGGG